MKKLNDIFDFEKPSPNQAPFEVPAGYFETFENRLEARIAALDEKPSSRRTVLRVLKPILGLAASFLLVFLLVKYPMSLISPRQIADQQANAIEDDNYMKDLLLSTPSYFDDKTLVQAMVTEPKQPSESEELISVLSEEITDYEIIAALNN